ncbi:MAG: hypothetical protein N3E50_09625 [Candidatus Goldbacteria bacterium]|nr:hypothetical protein [Candidatus Goldiibacteriota bacterium]
MRKFLLFLFFILFSYSLCFSEEKDLYKSEVLSKIPYKSVYFTQKNDYYLFNKQIIENYKIWKKNDKIRSEKIDENGNINTITIVNTKEKKAYIYMPGEKEGMYVDIKENDEVMQFFFGNSNRLAAKKVGEDKYNNEKCEIYEFFFTVNFWGYNSNYKVTEFRNKDGFVLKTITENTDSKEGNKPQIIEVLSYKKNPSINDKIFEIPTDIVFKNTSNLLSIFSNNRKTDNVNNNDLNSNTSTVNANSENEQNNTESNMEEKIIEETTKKAAETIFNNFFGR